VIEAEAEMHYLYIGVLIYSLLLMGLHISNILAARNAGIVNGTIIRAICRASSPADCPK
jgi:hypothetical protein